MKYAALLVLPLMLVACAHQQVAPYVAPMASSADMDKGFTAATTGAQTAASDNAKAQAEAALLYSAVTNATTNSSVWQEVVDLRSTINDTQGQLTNTIGQLNVATGRLTWYESNYTNTYGTLTNTVSQLQTAITDKNKALAGEAWWRKFATKEGVILGIILLAALGYVFVRYGLPFIAKLGGTALKAP